MSARSIRTRATAFGIAALAAAAILAYGTGSVRWENAYVALEAAEVAHPARGPEGERLRLANAMVESEPPRGMPLERRLHPVGTLAHLRYDTIGAAGQVIATTEVRALVPSLPAFGVDAPGGPLGEVECPRRCAQALSQSRGVAIARGGSPGLAPEWVLRMPVGRTLDMGTQSFTLQDIEDARPISLAQARYRVTLLEACPARVRVGAVTGIEFHPHAIVPIPQGLRTRRWVQADGCPDLLGRRPPRPEVLVASPRTARPAMVRADETPELDLIVPRREGPAGHASLVVDEGAMLRHSGAVQVTFRRICRHDAAARRWVPLPLPEGPLEVSGPGLMGRVRVAYRFPHRPALYWAEWSEVPADRGAARDFALAVRGGSAAERAASDGLEADPASDCPGGAAIARE